MKKYIITYADGKRRLTQTTYASREEAGDALMYYIDTNNADYQKGDDDYLNPFDFILVEIEPNDRCNKVIYHKPIGDQKLWA